MDETTLAKTGDELLPDDIHLAFHGPPEARRSVAVRLWSVVEGAVKQTLHPIAKRLGRDMGQEVEEFVQETWLLLLKDDGRTLRRWDPARGRSLKSWIYLVAQRHIVRKLKGHSSNPWAQHSVPLHELIALIDDDLPLGPSLVSDLDHIIYLQTLLDVLRKVLGEAKWRIFRSIFIDNRALADIAAEEHMDVSQIYDLSSYFRRQARAVAANLDSPPSPMPSAPNTLRRARRNICTNP